MATLETAVALYNYEAFMGGESDFTAVALDSGEKLQLRDYWKDGDVVIEFGSLT